MKSSMLKSFIAVIALMLGSLLFCFVAIEVIFRLLASRGTASVTWNDRPKHYFYSENSEGTGDVQYQKEKPSGLYRIAVIGDSFTFGYRVQPDDSFPKRLERMLNLNKNAPKIEVINFGVPSTSTNDQSKLLTKILTFSPDLVLLQITLNDPQLKPRRDPEKFSTYNDSIYRYWKSMGFIMNRIQNTISYNNFISYFTGLYEDPVTLRNFTEGLDSFKHQCKENKVVLGAVVFPFFNFPLNDRYPFHKVHLKIKELLQERNILNVDLFENYRNIPPDRLQTIPVVDAHPNEIGHRIAAEAVYEWLEKEKLVPESNYIKFKTDERIRNYRWKKSS